MVVSYDSPIEVQVEGGKKIVTTEREIKRAHMQNEEPREVEATTLAPVTSSDPFIFDPVVRDDKEFWDRIEAAVEGHEVEDGSALPSPLLVSDELSSRPKTVQACQEYMKLLRMQHDALNMQWLFCKFGPSAISYIQYGVNDMPFLVRQALLKAISNPISGGGDVYPSRLVEIVELYGYKKTRHGKKKKGMVTDFVDCAGEREPIAFSGKLEDLPPLLACHILVNYCYVPASKAEGKRKLKRSHEQLKKTEQELENVKAQRRALAAAPFPDVSDQGWGADGVMLGDGELLADVDLAALMAAE